MHPTLAVFRATSRAATNAKRLQTGLYEGRSILSGNNVGKEIAVKTRRQWKPNVQQKNVWCEALGRHLKLRVTTSALRTIDKCGGLDAYLFRMRPQKIGELGMLLREIIQDAHTAAKKKQEKAVQQAARDRAAQAQAQQQQQQQLQA
ncbi:hypothetical protein NBRC10512_007059 [Rhodotorula toruloides]|uniref:Large ribosomal subunit protein bL28m n=2 Tax=Rhodotorula toruloides TaxID=5286 RepID=A0A061BFR3_RHOTO|nr:50S ribosomal protein l24 [Rhodotorula toruloides NP11]EMS20930.1 50S ribosomal protein l24 [Rhodotorula toruloides NP11]KAJ8294979.1 50S ribosomal protein L28 [Rhodotorula toruloides]CDR48190.1 RHTO0S16e03202g1_1 [Rhodotorula toruloides]